MYSDVRLGTDRLTGVASETPSGKRYRSAIDEPGSDTFGELVEFAVRRRSDQSPQPRASSSPAAPAPPILQAPIQPVDFGAEPGDKEVERLDQPEIGGPSILPPPPARDETARPSEPPAFVPTGRLLGTRAEYQLDPESAKGSSYRGVAVRYWNVYSDGTKVMLEDWSRWTGTVDASLAKTDLEGGNVVGLVFGSSPAENA